MSDYTDHPGDLLEDETLARLTVEEKRTVARQAILEFPHLNHSMLNEWLTDYGGDTPPAEAALQEKTEALVDRLTELVESGEEPEALDHFIYGYLYPANLRNLGINPDEVAEREPLDEWNGVYEGE